MGTSVLETCVWMMRYASGMAAATPLWKNLNEANPCWTRTSGNGAISPWAMTTHVGDLAVYSGAPFLQGPRGEQVLQQPIWTDQH